jgi:catechol 2,3-dioxygenase-like lactoylglutathione lyase family enzyme
LLNALQGRNWNGRDWLMLIFGLADSRQLALIALRDFVPRRQRGLPKDAHHLAFAVSTKRGLGEWKKKLDEARVTYWEEDHGDQVSIYFEDPDGLVLEITAPPSWPEQRFTRDPRTLIRRWLKAGAAA